jgi:hypothetical protein
MVQPRGKQGPGGFLMEFAHFLTAHHRVEEVRSYQIAIGYGWPVWRRSKPLSKINGVRHRITLCTTLTIYK